MYLRTCCMWLCIINDVMSWYKSCRSFDWAVLIHGLKIVYKCITRGSWAVPVQLQYNYLTQWIYGTIQSDEEVRGCSIVIPKPSQFLIASSMYELEMISGKAWECEANLQWMHWRLSTPSMLSWFLSPGAKILFKVLTLMWLQTT